MTVWVTRPLSAVRTDEGELTFLSADSQVSLRPTWSESPPPLTETPRDPFTWMVTPFPLLLALTMSANPPLRFADALQLADRQSPELIDDRAAVAVGAAGVETAGAIPNPVVSLSYGSDDPRLFGAIEQQLPFLGQRSTAIDAARAELSSAQARLRWSRARLHAAVRRSYFALVAATSRRGLSDQLANVAAQLAEGVRKRFEAGTAAQLDVEQAALSARRASQDAADQAAEVVTARAELAVLLGLPPSAELATADPLEIPSAPAPASTASPPVHPELEAAQREQAAAEARIRREQVAVIPVPLVSVEVQHLPNGRDLPPTFGLRGALSFDVPVLSQNQGPIHQAEAERRQLQEKRVALANQLANALAAARTRFETAQAKARFYREVQIPASRRVAELARFAYSVGKAPLLSVLQAQSDLATDEGRAIDAALQAQVALADLEEASGAQSQ